MLDIKNQDRLSPTDISSLLAELTRRLDEAGVSARIHVIGGSALALLFPEDAETRVTNDVDALFKPIPEVQQIIAEMAEQYGLSPSWLNAYGANYLPAGMPSTGEVVTIASHNELIAMKLAASREQDLYDLGILARHSGISTAEELVTIAFDAYGEDSVILTDSKEDYLIMARDALARIKKS